MHFIERLNHSKQGISHTLDYSISEIIKKGASAMDFALPPGAISKFELYYDYLERSRHNFNLTSITGAADIVRLHFLDSIAIINAAGPAVMDSLSVIDVGSGAGFPGVPMKIAKPSIDLSLLDANGKRIAFLAKLCAALGISAAFAHARAEEASHDPGMRERFDVAVSRAVARLNVLCELSLPYVRVGGRFLAMKSVDSEDEIAEAGSAANVLGAVLADTYDYLIPGTDIRHRVVILEKVSPTPDVYPRRFPRINKNPL